MSVTSNIEPPPPAPRRTPPALRLPRGERPSRPRFPASITFMAVFATVVLITCVTGIATAALAFGASVISQEQHTAFEAMNRTFNLGIGAILGLIGGHSTR